MFESLPEDEKLTKQDHMRSIRNAGTKKSVELGLNFSGMSKEEHLKICSMGGKKTKGKIMMCHPSTNKKLRVDPNLYPEYYEQGWMFGWKNSNIDTKGI